MTLEDKLAGRRLVIQLGWEFEGFEHCAKTATEDALRHALEILEEPETGDPALDSKAHAGAVWIRQRLGLPPPPSS